MQRARSRRLLRAAARGLGELLDAVYPPRCRLCAQAAADDFACAVHHLGPGPPGARCGRCAAALPPGLPDGYRCAACRRESPGYSRLVALGDYGDPALREWVLSLKHGGRRDLALPLGRRLGARLAGAELARPGAVLVPVPLHALRRLERGYDQALLLAGAAAETSGLRAVRALRRVRSTPPQGAPGAPARALNVRGAFAPFALGRAAEERVAGREVWLLDDVVTSGATVRECARVLRRLGARSVAVLALARASPRPDR